MSTTSLHNDICSAFDGNLYPGDDQLTVGDPAGREFDETFQLLQGRDWPDMPVVEFIRGDTPIPDLTPEAFHYFLPALLIASLDDHCEANSDIAGTAAFFLSPFSARKTTGDYPYDDTQAYNCRMALFTESQRAVMSRVLEEYVARGWETREDIQETLKVLDSNAAC